MANIYLLTFHGSFTDLRASHVGQTHKNKHVLPIMRPQCMVHQFTSFLWPILLDFLTCGHISDCKRVVGSYPCRFVVVVKFICLHFLLPYCVGRVYDCRNTFHVSANENLTFITFCASVNFSFTFM